MKQVRTMGLVLGLALSVTTACRSDNDHVDGRVGNTGGSSSVLSDGGSPKAGADSGGAANTGGSSSVLSDGGSVEAGADGGGAGNTGGSSSTLLDAGNPNADASMSDGVPAIVGNYTDGYFDERISADAWLVGTSVFHIKWINNAGKFLIAQNDSANDYFPSQWSRFDWAWDSHNVLYFCQTAYSAESEQLALDTVPANAQDFAKGCSGFPWSALTALQDLDAGVDAGN